MLIVAPEHRRRRIGSALYAATLLAAKAEGHDRLALGSGGSKYVWPGVPADATEAIAFFERMGYAWSYTAIDLIAEMPGWVPPAKASAIAGASGVVVSAPASPHEI